MDVHLELLGLCYNFYNIYKRGGAAASCPINAKRIAWCACNVLGSQPPQFFFVMSAAAGALPVLEGRARWAVIWYQFWEAVVGGQATPGPESEFPMVPVRLM